MEGLCDVEKKFKNIKASFIKRFLASFLDVLFVLVITYCLFWTIYLSVNKKSLSNSSIWNFTADINVSIMFIYSLCLLPIFLIFFVINPLFIKEQTVFSGLFRIRAVSINNKKLNFKNWLKAYSTTIFLPILAHCLFFLIMMLVYGPNSKMSQINLKNIDVNDKKYLISLILKLLFSVVVLIQIHYFFTAAVSKKTSNWFIEFSELIYIDVKKGKLFNQLEEVEKIIEVEKTKKSKKTSEDDELTDDELEALEEEKLDDDSSKNKKKKIKDKKKDKKNKAKLKEEVDESNIKNEDL